MKQAKTTKQPLEVGVKFKSKNFSMMAEILEIHEKENIAWVLLTPKEGASWVEKDWNLEHTIWGFERGEYEIVAPDSKEGLHTQGWEIHERKDVDVSIWSFGRLIATVSNKETAELIVKAVNERKALLKMKKLLLELVDLDWTSGTHISCIVANAKTAINNAENI